MDGNLVVQIFILAFFLSLNNFLVSLGMGFSRIWGRDNLRIAPIFGLFDLCMPIAGFLAGKLMGNIIGSMASYMAPFVLAGLGIFFILQVLKKRRKQQISDKTLASTLGILFIAFWMSIDNLFVGFSLGLLDISLWLTIAIFGSVTFFMTLVGLTIGKKIRDRAQERIGDLSGKGRIITGVIFILVALWKFSEIL